MSNGGIECTGDDCHWSASPKGTEPVCVSGSGGCSPAHMVEAEESGFHDQQLIAATRKSPGFTKRMNSALSLFTLAYDTFGLAEVFQRSGRRGWT